MEPYDEGANYAREQIDTTEIRSADLGVVEREALARDFGIYYSEQDELTPVGLWRQYASDIGGHWKSYARGQIIRFDREGWI
jgi:hypothetical protein